MSKIPPCVQCSVYQWKHLHSQQNKCFVSLILATAQNVHILYTFVQICYFFIDYFNMFTVFTHFKHRMLPHKISVGTVERDLQLSAVT